jgi:hypothetical protein
MTECEKNSCKMLARREDQNIVKLGNMCKLNIKRWAQNTKEADLL